MKNEETNQVEQVVVTKPKSKPLKTVSGLDKVSAVKDVTTDVKPAQPAKAAAKPAVKHAKAPVKPAIKEHQAKTLPVRTPELPMSEKIWNLIKGRELGLFGLAGQTVEKYCVTINADPTRCMMKYKVSSVIPALEAAVPDFDFEVIGDYLVVSQKK
jgi:hypothetical protein